MNNIFETIKKEIDYNISYYESILTDSYNSDDDFEKKYHAINDALNNINHLVNKKALLENYNHQIKSKLLNENENGE